MKNSGYYLVPKSRIDAFRNLISSMQMAMDEIFDEPLKMTMLDQHRMQNAEQQFHEQLGATLLERETDLDLHQIF